MGVRSTEVGTDVNRSGAHPGALGRSGEAAPSLPALNHGRQ